MKRGLIVLMETITLTLLNFWLHQMLQDNRCHWSICTLINVDEASRGKRFLLKSHKQLFRQGGRCTAVETVHEPETMSDKLLFNLEGLHWLTVGAEQCNRCRMTPRANPTDWKFIRSLSQCSLQATFLQRNAFILGFSWWTRTRALQNKWIKAGASEAGLLKPCVWGGAMWPRVPGRRDGRLIVQALSGRKRSDTVLQPKEWRCMGAGRPAKRWCWACGNKDLHAQLFYRAMYW